MTVQIFGCSIWITPSAFTAETKTAATAMVVTIKTRGTVSTVAATGLINPISLGSSGALVNGRVVQALALVPRGPVAVCPGVVEIHGTEAPLVAAAALGAVVARLEVRPLEGLHLVVHVLAVRLSAAPLLAVLPLEVPHSVVADQAGTQ